YNTLEIDRITRHRIQVLNLLQAGLLQLREELWHGLINKLELALWCQCPDGSSGHSLTASPEARTIYPLVLALFIPRLLWNGETEPDIGEPSSRRVPFSIASSRSCCFLTYHWFEQIFKYFTCLHQASIYYFNSNFIWGTNDHVRLATNNEMFILTLVGSLMLPRPLIKTRHSVVASTRFREFPLGPRRRPTKLNCNKLKSIVDLSIKKKFNIYCGRDEILHTLGNVSTGISTLTVFLTIRPDELPCGLSQFGVDEDCNKPGRCMF
ncbi:hypothetical protein CR513_01551, partial [Mucuna pruriens]